MSGDATPELLGFEPDDPKPRRRVNGWEIALWVLGVTLLLGAIAVGYYFLQYIYAASTDPSPQIGFLSAFFQASSIAMPGLVTGGIACIALAIFARALDVNATRRESARRSAFPSAVPSAVAVPSAEPIAPLPTPRSAPVTPAESVEPGDYSAFMRPSDDSTNSNS
jgi:hypothetical protein